jgi:hypothetical protein
MTHTCLKGLASLNAGEIFISLVPILIVNITLEKLNETIKAAMDKGIDIPSL